MTQQREYKKWSFVIFVFVALVAFSILFGDRIRSWKEEKTETLSAKEEFIQNVQPKVDDIINEYDRIWQTHWKETFSGLSDHSVSEVDAYQAMDDIIIEYDLLKNKINAIEIPEKFTSSEENKLLIFKQDLQVSCEKRQEAALKTKDMITLNYYPASQTETVRSTVNTGDTYLLSAVNSYIKLSAEFGEKATFD